ncbi:MAG: 1-phosphofructokinase family hexose kinase [Spirochaetes bacterium]|nr:1-phosphofructokinase family hexose kinase [Spirochaetota bacterium]
MILITNLNTTIDKTHIVPHYKLNGVFRPQETIKVGGGKGINVARVLNKLKISCTVIGFLGGINTRSVKENFKKEKINFISIPIKGNSRDITIVVDPVHRSETVINEQGPAISTKEQRIFLQKFSSLIKRSHYLVLCGSQPPGLPLDFYGQLIYLSKRNKVFTILDTSGPPLRKSICSGPDLIKSNKNEFLYLIDQKRISFKRQTKDLLKKKISFIILTMGKKGCLGFDGKEWLRVMAPGIKKVSTVGSGDAFTAGLIFSFIKKYDFKQSLVFSTAVAAANALKIGAGNLDVSDIRALLPRVRSRALRT